MYDSSNTVNIYFPLMLSPKWEFLVDRWSSLSRIQRPRFLPALDPLFSTCCFNMSGQSSANQNGMEQISSSGVVSWTRPGRRPGHSYSYSTSWNSVTWPHLTSKEAGKYSPRYAQDDRQQCHPPLDNLYPADYSFLSSVTSALLVVSITSSIAGGNQSI